MITVSRVRPATTICAILASGSALAAGYKLPETSTNATALSAAYVANASGPDASYYNPARMALLDGGGAIQGDLTLVHLQSIKYRGTQTTSSGTFTADDSSEEEYIPVPTMHYMSPEVGNARFGLSVVSPGGLSKRWEGYAERAAEEFTLKIVEINPTVGYRINDKLAIGGGIRMVYTDGVVKSTAPAGAPTFGLARDLTGDSIDFGYNLAVQFEPNESWALAATYRSKVDLTVKGDAELSDDFGVSYDGSASVTVPLPAALAIAAAFDVRDDTTLEFVFERTFWSDYEELDFDYGGPITSMAPGGLGALLTAAANDNFADASPRDWKDVNTYRFGLTHQFDQKLTLMAGFALDKSPAPKQTIGFELPESDGKIFSLGARYKLSKQLELGGAVLYTKRDKLKLTAAGNDNGLTGEFSDAGAVLVSAGAIYRFD